MDNLPRCRLLTFLKILLYFEPRTFRKGSPLQHLLEEKPDLVLLLWGLWRHAASLADGHGAPGPVGGGFQRCGKQPHEHRCARAE